MKLFEINDNPLSEILNEVAVVSSWIEDLSYDDETGSVWMTTLSGGQYEIPEVPYEVFEEWINADSKGKHWWESIKGFYTEP